MNAVYQANVPACVNWFNLNDYHRNFSLTTSGMENITRIRLHYLFFAIVFFICWSLFKVGGIPDVPRALLSSAVDVVISMIALIIMVEVLMPGFVYNKKYRMFGGLTLLLIFMAGSAIILSQLALIGSSLSAYQNNIIKYQQHYFYWFWSDLIFGSYFLIFFICAVGASIRFAFDRIRSQGRIGELEKEKIHAELELLKSQINPHFLFNALNTVYYKIDRSNQSARDILQRFSDMLRYQLYECDKPFIAIEQELNFLASYIRLQEERLNNPLYVTSRGFENIKDLQISPFLLMPVVENCFKHFTEQADIKNHIMIECREEQGTFILTTSNSVDPAAKKKEGGLGLQNTRKRLQLLYPGKHELAVDQRPGVFKLTLKLQLT